MSNDDHVQYQLRYETYTDHDILCKIPHLIDTRTLSQEQYELLSEYTQKVELLHWLQERKFCLSKVDTTVSPYLAQEIDTQIKELEDKILKLCDELHNYKVKYPIVVKQLLDIGRPAFEEWQKEEDRKRVAEWRRKQDEEFRQRKASHEAAALSKTSTTVRSSLEQEENPSGVNVKQTKPKVITAILDTILTFIVYNLVLTAVALIFSFIILVLQSIPFVGKLLDWFFAVRGDSPDLMLTVIAPTASYYLTRTMIEKICKHGTTRQLVFKFLGICLIAIQIVLLFANVFLSGGGYIPMNIAHLIAGFMFFRKGNDSN